MPHASKQAAKQTAKQPLTANYIAQNLRVNGKPADARTIARILSANNRPRRSEPATPPFQPRPFNLLRQ